MTLPVEPRHPASGETDSYWSHQAPCGVDVKMNVLNAADATA